MGNRPTINLKFKIVDKQNAEKMLENAEKKDFYLTECNDDRSNSYARRQMTYSPNTTSMIDLRFYTLELDNLKDHIPPRLQTDLGEVTIIQLMPTADGGMPHTRPGNIICYPDIHKISSLTTLVHELWHIHQRIFQDTWKTTFYKLGWTEWKGKLPSHLENSRRYNPDTIDSPLWAFKDTWVPIPIFNDITLPKVNDTSIWFYHIKEHYHSKTIPDEIITLYPNLPQAAYEHPRELTAYMLSDSSISRESAGYKLLINAVGKLSELYDI